VRKLKNGYDKYKNKFLFKCFNCGKVGHFAAKCPYAKNESSDNEKDKHHQHKNSHKHDKHEKKKNSYKQKKSLYAKGISDLFEESIERSSDSNREETLFMEIKTNIVEDKRKEMMDLEEEENVETDGEVDLEEETICALRKIKKLRNMNLKQKEQLQNYE